MREEHLAELRRTLRRWRRAPTDKTFKRERWITEQEANVLHDLAYQEPVQHYIESGTANGFSACWAMLGILRRGVIPIVDTWDIVERPKIWDHEPFTALRCFAKCHVERYSRGVRLAEMMLRRTGSALFFIDGDHRASFARSDIRNTLHAAQPGDILLLHDLKHYDYLHGRFDDFSREHRTCYYDTERGMGAVWL